MSSHPRTAVVANDAMERHKCGRRGCADYLGRAVILSQYMGEGSNPRDNGVGKNHRNDFLKVRGSRVVSL